MPRGVSRIWWRRPIGGRRRFRRRVGTRMRRRGSSRASPAVPRILYKYFSRDRGVQALATRELWLSDPRAFNDLFDCNPHYGTHVAFQVSGSSIWHSMGEVKIGQLKTQNTVVLCFSTDPKSHLMWAHYGECHLGLALGFDPRARILANTSPHRPDIRPIKYSARRPSKRRAEDLTDEEVLYTKHSMWATEREWRLT